MATKMLIEDRFACSANALFALLRDQDFDDQMMEALGLGKELVELVDTPGSRKLRVKVRPPLDNIPTFMKKAVGSNNEYVEVREWRDDMLGNIWEIVPTFPGVKVDIRGTLVIEPDGEGACKRVVKGDFSVRLPLIGGKIEKFIIGQTEESFRNLTTYLRKYLVDHDIA